MSDPCDLTISRIHAIGEGMVVRIEARDHQVILVRIELSEQDFVAAMLDGKIITGALEMKGKV